MKSTGTRKAHKKKTRQGQSNRTIYGRPGPNGGNKNYRKRYRGQEKSGKAQSASLGRERL